MAASFLNVRRASVLALLLVVMIAVSAASGLAQSATGSIQGNTTYYSANTTTNVLTPQTTFGQMLGTTDPRIVQLAVKIAF